MRITIIAHKREIWATPDVKLHICFLYAVYQRTSLLWRHNERNGVSNLRHLDCLLNRLFKGISKKTYKLRVTGLCEGNSPVTGELPSQRSSNAETVSIRWRHHDIFGSVLRRVLLWLGTDEIYPYASGLLLWQRRNNCKILVDQPQAI